MNRPRSRRSGILSFIIFNGGFVILWFGFICYAFTTFTAIGAGNKNDLGSLFAAPTTLNIPLFVSRLGEEHTQLSDTEKPADIPTRAKNSYSIYSDEGAVIGSLAIQNKTGKILGSKFGNSDVYDVIFGSATELSVNK
jgi:hypothetical protein